MNLCAATTATFLLLITPPSFTSIKDHNSKSCLRAVQFFFVKARIANKGPSPPLARALVPFFLFFTPFHRHSSTQTAEQDDAVWSSLHRRRTPAKEFKTRPGRAEGHPASALCFGISHVRKRGYVLFLFFILFSVFFVVDFFFGFLAAWVWRRHVALGWSRFSRLST